MILQFLALLVIMTVVFFLGYRRGKTIRQRELQDMEIPELTPNEEEKLRNYYDFCKAFDAMMSDDDDMADELSGNTYEQVKYGDDYFTGNIKLCGDTETDRTIKRYRRRKK